MEIKELWEKSVAFHGHECPGLAYGVRASMLALEKLGIKRAEDEEIVVITETDACGVDGIQVLTGCTMGKGNLIFRDIGKQAFTFINRKKNEGLRIVMKNMEVMEENLAEQEKRRLKTQLILNGPEEEVCSIQWVKPTIPEKARIFNSVRCQECGENFMEARGRLQNGKIVCLDCFKEYKRGW